jgi:hypothetical protein
MSERESYDVLARADLLCDKKLFIISGMVPHTPVWRVVLGVIVMAIGGAIGIPLARYAERDDAPGGVVIATLLMVAAAALAIWIVNQRPESRAQK